MKNSIKHQITKRKFTIHLYELIVQYVTDCIISMSPRLMPLLLYEQICNTINISKRSVSMHFTGDKNFESELEWRIQSVNPM